MVEDYPGEQTAVYRDLRRFLRDATGESEFVLAVNLDIRGFSSFFNDSSQAAAFLGSAYTRILDRYFPEHSFFKPTGDGMLIVRTVTRDALVDVVRQMVAAALELDGAFANICEEDDLINFATPAHVGIGLARGTATRIASGRKVLDYSGFPLNLCSRLMDLARPHGVVFDQSLGSHLLDAEMAKRFTPHAPIYIKGLFDTNPTKVFVTGSVEIPAANRVPFGAELFHENSTVLDFRTFKHRGKMFSHELAKTPIDDTSVNLTIERPVLDERGRIVDGIVAVREAKPLAVRQGMGCTQALFDYGAIARDFEQGQMKPWMPLRLRVSYSAPIGTGPAEGAAQAERAVIRKWEAILARRPGTHRGAVRSTGKTPSKRAQLTKASSGSGRRRPGTDT